MDGFLYFICFGAAILGAEAAGVGSYSFQDSNGNSFGDFPFMMPPMIMEPWPLFRFASNMDRGFRNMGQNNVLAYAGLANDVGHQIAAINPENPAQAHLAAMKEASNMAAQYPNYGGYTPYFYQQQSHYNTFSSQNNPNVDTINRFSDKSPSDRNHKSVSSSSFSSSATGPNGETIQRQMAHTVIDNNGDVREYHVEKSSPIWLFSHQF